MSTVRAGVLVGLALCAAGCASTSERPDGAIGADGDGPRVDADVHVGPTTNVDVLLVLDNQPDARGQSAAIGAMFAIEWLVRSFTDRPEISFRVATIGGDMGVGAVADAGDGCTALGNDALVAGGGPTAPAVRPGATSPPGGMLTNAPPDTNESLGAAIVATFPLEDVDAGGSRCSMRR